MVFVLVCLVLGSAGILGGYAGFLLESPEPFQLPLNQLRYYRYRSIVLGVVGAFLAPVFFTLANAASGGQGDLMKNVFTTDKYEPSDWFVLFGFALLAAISAQKLISNLTEKVFNEMLKRQKNIEESVQLAADEAAKTKAHAEEVQDDISDLQEDLEIVATQGNSGLIDQETAQAIVDESPLDEVQSAVLHAMANQRKQRATASEIAEILNLTYDQVSNSLKELAVKGLVRSKEYHSGNAWRLQYAGKQVFRKLSASLPSPTSNETR